jgi:hypothetical protein
MKVDDESAGKLRRLAEYRKSTGESWVAVNVDVALGFLDDRAKIKKLTKAVKAIQAWRRMHFDYRASLFYRETGYMAPGKSLPMATATGDRADDTVRREQWEAWCERKNDEIDRQLAAALRGEGEK